MAPHLSPDSRVAAAAAAGQRRRLSGGGCGGGAPARDWQGECDWAVEDCAVRPEVKGGSVRPWYCLRACDSKTKTRRARARNKRASSSAVSTECLRAPAGVLSSATKKMARVCASFG